MDTLTLVLTLLSACGLILYILRKNKGAFHPGPRGLPLLGNIFDVPQTKPWLVYQRWSREYNSDIIHCNMMGNHIFVLNSSRVAFDLLEKRSSIYSDRHQLTLLNKILDCNWLFSVTPYNDWWRAHRRMFHRFFNPTAVLQFQPQLTKNSRKFIRRLLDTPEPENLAAQLRLTAGATILEIVYGFNVESEHDPYIVIAEKAMHVILTSAGGAYLVDSVPILRYFPFWFPGAGFQQNVTSWKKYLAAMLESPFSAVNSSLRDDNVISHSVTMVLLNEISADDLDDDVQSYQEKLIKEVMATAYAGGVDTTSLTLLSFIHAMLLYPDIQRKAHEELDRVIGRSRLPTLSDRESLPFIYASIIEALRWRPLLPLAVPRRLTTDDVYEGYHLPKGSIIIANSWAILHDEQTYEDPSIYNPDRFLNKDGQLKKDAKVTNSAVFGYGRRVCAGKYFAELSLWINIATLLWTFEITKTIDKDGNVVEPPGPEEYVTAGLSSYPKPFRCRFQPRSHQIAEIARATDLEI